MVSDSLRFALGAVVSIAALYTLGMLFAPDPTDTTWQAAAALLAVIGGLAVAWYDTYGGSPDYA